MQLAVNFTVNVGRNVYFTNCCLSFAISRLWNLMPSVRVGLKRFAFYFIFLYDALALC